MIIFLFKDVFAKAKTLISSSFDPNNEIVEQEQPLHVQTKLNQQMSTINLASPAQSPSANSFAKQFFNSNQPDGHVTNHTVYFKQMRDQTIGRYVIQTNKLLITLDKLITFDSSQVSDEAKRDRECLVM